jgi:hypothetical protein
MACPPEPLQGRRIVLAGLVGAVLGLSVSLFLQAIVAHTPVTVSSSALVWFRILLASFGSLGGMAIETVRQLQVTNPDPAYHRKVYRTGRSRDRI